MKDPQSVTPTITQRKQVLIKNMPSLLILLTLFSSVLTGCQSDSGHKKRTSKASFSAGKPGEKIADFKTYKMRKMALPGGQLIKAYIAQSNAEQTQGLSGVKPEELSEEEGMLFWYDSTGPRMFWMPNTYINLEIIFLDKNFKILHISHNVPAHPGMQEPPAIARTPVIYAHYVLELKTSSPLAQNLKAGDQLTLLD